MQIASDAATVCSLPASPTWKSTNSSTEAMPARVAALPHVGSTKRRSARASPAALLRCSSAVGLRPVRPRASIAPAALPRCLVRRLRLVWAMAETLAPQQHLDRRRHAQLDVGGPAVERGQRGRRDELAPCDRMVARDRGEHVGGADAAVILDVGRDLDDAAALQPQPE